MASHLDFDDFGTLGFDGAELAEPIDPKGPSRDVDEGWPEAFERRDFERNRVDAEIELVVDGHCLSAELENDHAKGAFIRADHELRLGQILSLRKGAQTREMEVVHVQAVPRSLTGMCLAGAGLRQVSSQDCPELTPSRERSPHAEAPHSEPKKPADARPLPRRVNLISHHVPVSRRDPGADRSLPPRSDSFADRSLPPRANRAEDRPLSQGGSLASRLRGYRR